MAIVKSNVKKIQFVTPAAKAIFPHISAPDTTGKFADNKFKLTLEFRDGDAGIELIREMAKKAVQQEKGDVEFVDPFREGKDKYADRRYISAKSKTQPAVVDSKRKPLADVNMGDTVKVAVTIGVFELSAKERVNGKLVTVTTVNVNFWLNAVQVVERGGAKSAVDLFGDEDGFEGDDEEVVVAPAAKPAAKVEDDDDSEMPF